MATVDRQLVGREKFRRMTDKMMRQVMVSRFEDRLTQMEADDHAFRRPGKNIFGGMTRKTTPRTIVGLGSGGRAPDLAEVVKNSTGNGTSKSNTRKKSVLIDDDQFAETMTQGSLNNRLNTLTGMGLISQYDERVQSAKGSSRRRLLNLEREKTFPGHKTRSRHTTALINWAVNMSSRTSTRGSDNGSLDSDPAMNFLMRRYAMPEDETIKIARAKAREKINSSLSLPIDRLARIATLRQNVKFIEGKFRTMLYKQRNMDSREDTRSQASVAAAEEYWPSRFTKQGEAVGFFRRRVRMIIMVLRWINMVMDMNKHSKWERQLKTFVDLAMDMEDNTNSGVTPTEEGGPSFDKNDFKANKEISLSMDVKTILSTRPEARTPEMIKQVMIGLQTLQSLGEYPLDTQEQLCRVAWFQQVPARKYIIRQGHKPEAFYFILSGLAVVKKIELDEASGEEQTRVVARLTRGQSFGELGLIFKTPRNATVESGTVMELLVVGKQDFLKIFMHNVKPGEDPDHIAFLKQQPVLKYWPFEMLKEDPSACLINYFKRGTLVTESGKASEWIYFIKSGSCEALKRLKAVTPRSQKELRRKQHTKPKRAQSTGIGSRQITPRKAQKQALHPELFRSMTEYYDDVRSSAAEEMRASRLRKALSGTPRRTSTATSSQRHSLTIPEIIEPHQSNGVRQVYLKRTPPTEDTTPYPLPPIPPQQPEGPGISRSKFQHLSTWFGKGNLTVPSLSALENTYMEKEDESETPVSSRSEKEEVYVTVEKLQSRDIFGLNTVSFNDEEEDQSDDVPEVSLVSKGAEIVMLSKKMFLKHADERVKLVVQELITPYPGEAQLQENLQIQADWNNYKQQVLGDVMYMNHALRQSMSGLV